MFKIAYATCNWEIRKVPSGLKNLKSKADELDIDKLNPVSVNLKKLSDAIEKKGVQKDVYDELVKKVNTIQTADTSHL